MLCCHCAINQASKGYERVKLDGKKTVRTTEYYCLDCYHRLFISAPEGATKLGKADVCPACGMTVAAFKAKKLVGCAHCYRYLSAAVLPVVLKMQGAEAHCGKEERASEQEKLSRRAHEVQILYDKKKAEKHPDAKLYEKKAAELRAELDGMKKGELT